MRIAWSNLAKNDLVELRRFSVRRWGRDIALGYLGDLTTAAKLVSGDPDRARPLKGPYRILRVRSHYLIVHVDTAAKRVTIARVLHAAMEIERHLS